MFIEIGKIGFLSTGMILIAQIAFAADFLDLKREVLKSKNDSKGRPVEVLESFNGTKQKILKYTTWSSDRKKTQISEWRNGIPYSLTLADRAPKDPSVTIYRKPASSKKADPQAGKSQIDQSIFTEKEMTELKASETVVTSFTKDKSGDFVETGRKVEKREHDR